MLFLCLCLVFLFVVLFSARVSNALGAGCPHAARLSVYAAMAIAVSEAILVSSIIFASRRVLGYIFSNEQDVVEYVTDMAPLISLSVIVDSLHGTLSGWLFTSFFYNSMHKSSFFS
jgi:multidrug resistance protein, MATE family